MRKFLGFTLIEVLVTVAIVAILAAIAIPSYSQYLQKTRRTDAQEKLLDMAAQQERWFFNKNQYTDDVADVGGATSKDGYYTVTISNLGSKPYTKYTLTATPVTTKSQNNDSECTSFTIDNTGARHAFKGSTPKDDFCWPK
ncbi:MAG TPA: type IV pilin protein [Cellvibrionaceae bacterium]|nr:type IV pilin protein [Cellvibrionaceae bacterium]HMW70666.1 type IV pilin protein [Cellvibrionaceae bacterium]HNG61410.1 type IV pilin protein [Cellvibrionaceae bacterium]